MTFWEALRVAVLGVGGLFLFLVMMWWTMETWDGGEWQDRVFNLAAWVLVIALAVWGISQSVVPT